MVGSISSRYGSGGRAEGNMRKASAKVRVSLTNSAYPPAPSAIAASAFCSTSASANCKRDD
eukprot:9228574-Pyramimonas_sp.AAC.1